MCGRYTLKEDEEKLEDWFDAVARGFEGFGPNYNVAPSQKMPVVGENRKGERTIRPFRWGLIPFWAKKKKISYSMINARGESLDAKKSYQQPFRQYRCLIPASGFYEWKGPEGDKTPYYIYPTHEPLFSFAGLYNVWESPEGEKIPSFTIVTTEANRKLNGLHDRMPVILLKEEWKQWLDPGNRDIVGLKELLRPFPDDAIDFYEVGKAVNNIKNNSPELIEAAD